MIQNKISFLFTTLFILLLSSSYSQDKTYFNDLAEAIITPEKVEVLDLSNQTITNLPEDLSLFQNLHTLRLNNSRIVSLPKGLKKLPLLKRIELNDNPLLNISQVISTLDSVASLKHLALENCNINNLPSSIGEINQLQHLDISNNTLARLPNELHTFFNLESIDLSNNELKKIDYLIYYWFNLKEIDLRGNPDLEIEKVWPAMVFKSELEKIAVDKVGDVDEKIAKYIYVKSLEISDNYALTDISEKFLQNINVESLSISNCPNVDPKKLSGCLAGMKNLKSLELHLDLKEIPASISNLTNLEKIDLSGNMLTSTESLEGLKDVQIVNVSQNHIETQDLLDLKGALSQADIVCDLVGNKERKGVDPPIQGVDVTYKTYEVAAEQGGRLTFDKSVIEIPANAFLDKNGKVVNGEVKINYREFKNPEQIFLSGITMQYDSLGTNYQFSSAGMVEFNAYDEDGKELYANPQAQVKVNMICNNNSPEYNLYTLENDGSWKYEGKDDISSPEIVAKENGDEAQTYNDSLFRMHFRQDSIQIRNFYLSEALYRTKDYQFYYEKPLLSVTKVRGLNTFSIDFSWMKLEQKHNENELMLPLSNIKKMPRKYTFYYDGDNYQEDYDSLRSISATIKEGYNLQKRYSDNKKRMWYPCEGPVFIQDIDLVKNEEVDNYLLKIQYKDTLLSIPVALNIKTMNSELAQRRYERFYKTYLRNEKKKEVTWARKNRIFDVETDRRNNLLAAGEESFLDYWRIAKEDVKNKAIEKAMGLYNTASTQLAMQMVEGKTFMNNVVRSFRVTAFGISNLDHPIPTIRIEANPPKRVLASFVDEYYQKIDYTKAYVLDYSDNTVYSYKKGQTISVQNNHSFRIVLLTADDKMAVVKRTRMMSSKYKSKKSKIIVELKDTNGLTEEELLAETR